MAIRLIFCYEANKRAATDNAYVSEVINRFYKLGNDISFSRIYMGGKSRYNHKDTIREINEIKKFCREAEITEVKVIYITDTDSYESRPEDKRYLKDINDYCKKNNYDHIWFCHDVEEVFWGDNSPIDNKVKKAGLFKNKKLIDEIDERKLKSIDMKAGRSNILAVLDRYLTKR